MNSTPLHLRGIRMRLLFDQNLSHRLIGSLEDLFQGSLLVRSLELHKTLQSGIVVT
jgi:hypothetical protein